MGTGRLTDVDYLRDVQYRDSRELAKRADLHTRYRTAAISAFAWFGHMVGEQVGWPDGAHVLDVGCGPGALWRELAGTVPSTMRLTLADLSPGMVDEAVAVASAAGAFADVRGQVADARELPFDDAAFDLVVSTYALYHVPEPERAVDELARVVRPGGAVAIMTNGPGHLREIAGLLTTVFGSIGGFRVNERFSPVTAAAALIERFDAVAWHRYDDELHVTDVDDLLRFATSTPPASEASPAQLAQMRAAALATMAGNAGTFVVSKDTGAFIASRHHRADDQQCAAIVNGAPPA